MRLNEMVEKAYDCAKRSGFHDEKRHFAVGIALLHSELSEALEAHREGDRDGMKEEFADIAIRLGDMCGEYGIDLEQAVQDKMAYNEKRAYRHGKKY